jgi:hypothetical protein
MKRTISAFFMAAALLAALPAAAAEQTRETYKDTVEPICRANTKANERILAGVRKEVKENKLKTAATKFSKAADALKRTWGQLKNVPPPAGDEARLAKWLDLVSEEAELFARTATKLRSGQKAAALGMVVRLTSTANRANSQVLPFDFTYCRFEPSKFT